MKLISGISEIIDKYDIFILDQWGVIHDGKKGYTLAIECVQQLVKQNKKLIIISNSSKRKSETITRLPKLGFKENQFIEVMTSGEMVWNYLKNKTELNLGKNCFHIYDNTDKKNAEFVNGLDFNFVESIEQADFILGCTPQHKYSITDYVPILKIALKKEMTFICANPDFESVEISSKNKIYCMGSIAELYSELGGKVIILGKPSIEIYREATKKIINFQPSKTIAIGDSIYHDIKGANTFGIDSTLILSGIHSSLFNISKPEWNTEKNFLKKTDIVPTYLSSYFQL